MRGRVLWVPLGVLAIQAALSALVFTPAPHTGGDNAGYVALAHSLVERGTYQELWDPGEPPHTKYPPVFPLALGGLLILGVQGWVGLKSVSLVATLLAGLFAFLWARRRGGLLVGTSVALLLAVSDGVLYYSHWILSDPLFLALTLGALWALEGGQRPSRQEAVPIGDAGTPTRDRGEARWLASGAVLVVLAYFTRSAGIPLVAATLLWLTERRRWKALAWFGVAFLVPALLWWLRGRLRGGSAYVAEFWLVDPYQPDLGRVGLLGLLGRVAENLHAYVTGLIPEGIVGLEGPFLAPLGILLALLATLGWIRSLVRERWLGDLFFPLYFGLMLLWPAVWSGDRFALPLLPLIFVYAAGALGWLVKGWRLPLRQGVGGAGFLLLALPALASWAGEIPRAQACRDIARNGDPWSCYPSNIQEYVALARWSGERLPEEAAVTTRKPRIFYLLSGVEALSLPLTSDPEAFLDRVRERGSRYLTLDRWDGLAGFYVPPVVQAHPEVFCLLTALGPRGGESTLLLGVSGVVGEGEDHLPGEPGRLGVCRPELTRSTPRPQVPIPPGVIPLLAMGRGQGNGS